MEYCRYYGWKSLEALVVMIKNVWKKKSCLSGILGECPLEIQSCFWPQLLLFWHFIFIPRVVKKEKKKKAWEEQASGLTIRNRLHIKWLPCRSMTHHMLAASNSPICISTISLLWLAQIEVTVTYLSMAHIIHIVHHCFIICWWDSIIIHLTLISSMPCIQQIY